jgi:hypothetical protein
MRLATSIAMFVAFCVPAAALAEGRDNRAWQNQFGLAPIYTLNARNVQGVTVNLSHEDFDNVRIEEAEDFDGATQTAELIIPFGERKRWEIRLEVPFHTDGNARTVDGGRSIDIDGNGGVFDFATLVVQRELGTTENCAVNSSVYFGFGYRTKELETDIDDKYNHRGRMVRLGGNLDNARADNDLRLQATADLRYYFDIDDLNPSSSSDSFTMLDVSGALVYNADFAIKPGFEVLYSTDFDERKIIQAVPELILPIADWLEIKGAYAYGHSRGEGSVQTLTLRTTVSFL